MDKLITPRAICAELDGVAADYLEQDGTDLLGRFDRHQAFWDGRLAAGLDPYCRTSSSRMGPACDMLTRGYEQLSGVNFASHDYLSLGSHPDLQQAVVAAAQRWGVHAGGSVMAQGGSLPLVALEERIADMLACQDVTLFPSGWAAGYGTIRAIIRPGDHVLIDGNAGGCLREGADAATVNVHQVQNRHVPAIAEQIKRIRAADARAGILIATEALFSANSEVADLRDLQNLCRLYGATLLVDVSNDLGAIGNGGLGFLGDQAMVGEVDIVIGSFSRTFASNGGFVASRSTTLKQALRVFAGPLKSSGALSPVQAAVALAAFEIVQSAEGVQRRRALMANVMRLRNGLAAHAFTVLGQPSAIVPVALGTLAEGRVMTKVALAAGALVNNFEHQAIGGKSACWPLLVMADHTAEHIDKMIAVALLARARVVQAG